MLLHPCGLLHYMIHIPSKQRIHIFLLVAQNWLRKYTTILTCDQCSALGSLFYSDFWIVHSLENMTNSIGKECKEKLNKILSLSMFLRLHKTYKCINKSCTCTRDCISSAYLLVHWWHQDHFIIALGYSLIIHHSSALSISSARRPGCTTDAESAGAGRRARLGWASSDTRPPQEKLMWQSGSDWTHISCHTDKNRYYTWS